MPFTVVENQLNQKFIINTDQIAYIQMGTVNENLSYDVDIVMSTDKTITVPFKDHNDAIKFIITLTNQHPYDSPNKIDEEKVKTRS